MTLPSAGLLSGGRVTIMRRPVEKREEAIDQRGDFSRSAMVKLGVQESLLPGESLAEKVAAAEDLGFEGIELWGNAILDRAGEVKAALEGRRIKASTICAGYPGALVAADAEARKVCRAGIMARLRVAAELEMVGLIVVPVFNDRWDIPDLSPSRTSQELSEALLVAQLREMAPEVEKLGGPCILLEALNRYEARFLTKQEKAAELARQVNSPAVQVMCDLFHMNIEETDTPAALAKVGKLCKHVHLADNTRLEPGTGTINFKAAFAALRESGFDGYMVLECGLSGDATTALKNAVAYLRSCI